PAQVEAIVSHIDSTGTIEGAPGLKPEHLAVFDCSFRPQNGTRSIHYMGHLKMMAAVQPFVSGAISKTINMPEECTVEEVMKAYTESWRMGLKAVAIYRDNSKRVQPLSSGTSKGAKAATGEVGDTPTLRATEADPQQTLPFSPAATMEDAPTCAECGSIMTRNGSCYKCGNCGGTSGCS